tara:strand:- start:5897 stop:7798 length:1902 start_codon:yes stop_codon:yes gene_type:complete
MKIAYNHLLKFLVDEPTMDDISSKLFQLGHEHEIEGTVFNMEFTPNRGDCLSLLGIARDLNVFYKTSDELSLYEPEIPKLDLNFINHARDKCSAISFLNIEVEHTVTDYADYLEDYFDDLKLNKNNFFTDVSNYIAYEMGQPTHCYDFNSIDKNVVLTNTKSKDNFKTLLDKEINLNESDLVFMNNNKVINLAGVVGGMETSCSKQTRNVLVECAYFLPESIIGKALKYNIQSDAAHKFERGVDPKCHERVLRRFIQIINDHTKIINLSVFNDIGNEFKDIELDIDLDLINEILGIDEKIETYQSSLSRLGFIFNEKIKVPPYRNDIHHQNDLAEEFARVIGYDNIPSKAITFPKLLEKNSNQAEKNIKSFLVDNGFSEVINYPFCSSSNKDSIQVDNPLDTNRGFLRTSLLESIIDNVTYNEKRQNDSIKIFEISDVYSTNMEIIDKRLSLVISGRQGHNYKDFGKPLDKNYLKDLFSSLSINLEEDITEVSREKLNTKIKTKIFSLEVNMKDICKYFETYIATSQPTKDHIQYNPISDFPSSSRDLSFSIEDNSKIGEVIKKLDDVSLSNLKESFMFDFFENSKTNITKVGYRFTFQSFNKTLTDQEIDNDIQGIIDSILLIESVSLPGIK